MSTIVAKPPSVEYSDNILYGARREARKLRESIRLINESECVMFAIGTYADKKQWSLKNLYNTDKRLKSMLDGLDIKHAFSIQRYCWPLLNDPNFPMLCVSPESSGKTHAHLLYVVAQSITKVPISRTDEILMNYSQLGSLELIDNEKSKNVREIDNNGIFNENIDYDNFDFNKLDDGIENTGTAQIGKMANGTNVHNNLDGNLCDQIVGGDGQAKEVHDGWSGDMADLEEFITHPRYIIVCSSQINVERLNCELEEMKQKAYCGKASMEQRKSLPPQIRSINVHQTDDTLALRCNESEILVGTPGALLKCFLNGYLTFSKCHKIIFDDLDATLQLHNTNVFRLIKLYTNRHDPSNLNNQSSEADCQVYMFSRKWTELVKGCVNYISAQKIIIFGSLVEASIFTNLRFNLELYSKEVDKLQKLDRLLNSLKSPLVKTPIKAVAIVCNTDKEASTISNGLNATGHQAKYLPQNEAMKVLSSKRNDKELSIYVMSDIALELIANILNNTLHVIHLSLPAKILTFDQRFRLMYKNITENKSELNTTIFIGPLLSNKYAKELYDLLSRSNNTLRSTKLELRDRIRQTATRVCWRWATTGICRLDKLSQDDRLGSYCPNRHSITLQTNDKSNEPAEPMVLKNSWPESGQLRITITEIVSPSEFYFWFEAYRDADSPNRQWTKFKNSGFEHMKRFQIALDKLKNVPNNTVDLTKVRKGSIFGIYQQQEARVDRVMLLEDLINSDDGEFAAENEVRLNKKLEMTKVLEVFKIDYGVRQTARVGNLITLPEELENDPPKCHRGFLLGMKPTDSEPDWLYQSTKRFHELVSRNGLNDITVWLRLNSDGCFWFENMVVTWRVKFPDETKMFKIEPQKELIFEKLAEECKSTPNCLNPSTCSYTLSKWNAYHIASYARYAKPPITPGPVLLLILFVDDNLRLKVRLAKFNTQLLNLEDQLIKELASNQLERLDYLEEGSYCIAKTVQHFDPKTNQPEYVLNRCMLKDSCEINGETYYHVDCLDHGDHQVVGRKDLYQAKVRHLSILPFQAFVCEIADLNESLLKDRSTAMKVENIIYDETRSSENNYVSTRCYFTPEGKIQTIYTRSRSDRKEWVPLISIIESNFGMELVTNKDPDLRVRLSEVDDDDDEEDNDEQEVGDPRMLRPMDMLARYIMMQIAEEELKAAAAAQNLD